MGAPGLAFETWDPSRKGRKTKLENSNFEKASGTDATIEFSRTLLSICVEDPRSQKRDLGHPSAYPGNSQCSFAAQGRHGVD